jgi:flagellar biosynthesis protein FlhF
MLLKTFTAPDLATALAEARAEMGPDALVLATREIPGRLGLGSVEVTVGASRPETVPDNDARDRLRSLVTRIGGSRPAPPAAPRAAAPASRPTKPATAEGPLSSAVAALVAAGVSRDLAARFAKIGSCGLPRRATARHIAEAAERGIAGLLSFSPLPLRSRCLFIVGPPGAGKTTTVAKLAARIVLASGRRVVFGEADGDRIGSMEQAEIFCRHIGAKPVRLDGPADLKRALRSAGTGGAVLVDTPGVGARDSERMAFITGLREAAPTADLAVLVPSGLHWNEAKRILERFAPLRPTCVAFARVDDGDRPGELVTALADAKLPLSFITTGHQVPEDLESATPRGLAALLLRVGHQAAHPLENPR